MTDPLFHATIVFIEKYCHAGQKVLLALSGGPDSLALFHLLLQYANDNPLFSFAVAHVDHGWRKESAGEAKSIEQLCKDLSVPFHLKTLPKIYHNRPQNSKFEADRGITIRGNLEAYCREERLAFFANLCLEHKYQGVMLAHHADDVAETVLKRVLEGVTLPYLCGLRPETAIFKIGKLTYDYPVKLWRPLLQVGKKEIENWLASKNLKGFHDVTNFDPKFMRGRLRTKIIPGLKDTFGKDIASSLCRLSDESVELRDYFDEKLAGFASKIEWGPIGSYLDLSEERPSLKLEIKYLLRRFCELSELPLTFAGLHNATELFISGQANKRVSFGKKYLHIDRYRLFVPHDHLLSLSAMTLPLKFHIEPGSNQRNDEGTNRSFCFGNWTVDIKRKEKTDTENISCWKRLWTNTCAMQLPFGQYEMIFPQSDQKMVCGSLLFKWYRENRVPSFLRMHVPVICRNGEVCLEFLTGTEKKFSKINEAQVICLSFCKKSIEGE